MRNTSVEANQTKQARVTVEKLRTGGNATTSNKGKAPAEKATKDIPLHSTSAQADAWTTPDE